MLTEKYDNIRDELETGDVVAFGGESLVSKIIKWFTRSPVSHVGIILRITEADGDFLSEPGNSRDDVFIVESTSLDGFEGLHISRLSKRVDEYNGKVWIFPLSWKKTLILDKSKIKDFLFDQVDSKVKYDTLQAIFSAVDLKFEEVFHFDTYNEESYLKFFCSELVAAALKVAGVINMEIDASEVTPADLVSWNIYMPHYYQLKGKITEIKNYNKREKFETIKI